MRDWTPGAPELRSSPAVLRYCSLIRWATRCCQVLALLLRTGSPRTIPTPLLAGIVEEKLDESIETEKDKNDFLVGVPAIVDALNRRQIECRVYTREKFHAKAYITHAKQAVVGAAALVGSSNFTVPGVTDNVELNVQLRREVELLQAWYERHWEEAREITPDILRIVERHIQVYRDPVVSQGSTWLHDTKAHIVENCLFGVDIQQQAIEICRLRLCPSQGRRFNEAVAIPVRKYNP